MPLCVSCALATPLAGGTAEKDGGEILVRTTPKVNRNVSPGDSGGESNYKPLQMWGKAIEHPLENKNDYIWNINWKPFFDGDEQSSKKQTQAKAKEPSSGYLSFSRVMDIDRVDVDLTKELLKSDVKKITIPMETNTKPTRRWNYAPTRKERQYWDRSRKASESVKGSTQDAAAVSLAKERQKFKELARRLQILTVTIGGAGTACSLIFYSSEVSLSYGVGLLGSFAYIRMLGSSVDGLGRRDAKGAIKGTLGQPRLLVPLILTMALNRWNQLLVPEYGVTQLQMIPMLVGFFTYKIATVVQVVQDVLPERVYEKDA